MAQNDKKARLARRPSVPPTPPVSYVFCLYRQAAVPGDEAIQKRYFKFAIVGTRVTVTAPPFPFFFELIVMCIQVTVNVASRALSGSISIDIISIDALPDDHLAYIVSSQASSRCRPTDLIVVK